MATQVKTIVLDAEGIDCASEAVAEFLAGTRLDHRSALSARLTIENALLSLRDHFGEDTKAQVIVSNRLGKPRLLIRVRGSRFDPREQGDETDWERTLMQTAGLRPSYAYNGGYNIIGISCPRPPLGSTTLATVAIITGAVLARAGLYLPETTRTMLLDGLVNPVFDTYVGMLSGVAGPMVFLSVACGICGIGDMAALGRSGKALIGRHMVTNLLAVALAFAAALPLFHLRGDEVALLSNPILSISSIVLGLFPTNLFQPFIEGNTLQIIMLSAVVGIAVLSLGDLAEGVREALNQLNMLVQFLMEQLCRLLPMLIVVMSISQTWSGTLGALFQSWLPILVTGLVMVVFLAAQFLFTSTSCGIGFRELITTCFPSMATAFITASPSAAFGTMLTACRDYLGVDHEQSSFGVPLGMVLCKPMTAILLTVVMMYSAHAYGMGGSVLWYAQLAISCLLYAVAVPPVPGGMLACYGMLLTSLGIPMDALAVVTALDLLLDNCCSGGNVGSQITQIVLAADSLGALDHSAYKDGDE